MTKSGIPYQYYPRTVSLYYRRPAEYQEHERVGVPTPVLCAVLLPRAYCAPISFTSSSLERGVLCNYCIDRERNLVCVMMTHVH